MIVQTQESSSTGNLTQRFEEIAQNRVVESARSQRYLTELTNSGCNDLRMAVPEIKSRVCGQHIKVLFTLRNIDESPFRAAGNHYFGKIVVRAQTQSFFDYLSGINQIAQP